MPRRRRIHIDGLSLHIVQRGHHRAACFFDDQDRFAYLGWLREALERERCRLHAYGLMTNHLHLLLCQRYIKLNPVRAGMVADPADHRWSSYRANALGAADPLLSPHPLYLALGADDDTRSAQERPAD